MSYILCCAFLILLFIAITLGQIIRQKQNLKRLKSQWGKLKNEYFNFELIGLYFDINKGACFHELSEQTKKDIDFYDLFCFVDRTETRIGQQYLFDQLSKPINDLKALELLNLQSSFFLEDVPMREKVQLLLSPLGKEDAYYIPELLKSQTKKSIKLNYLLLLDSIVAFVLIILVPVYSGAIVILLVLFALNMLLHLKNKGNTFHFAKSFKQLNLLINISRKLFKEKIPFPFNEEQKSAANLGEFQKGFLFLSFGQTHGGDLSQLLGYILELVKAYFLLEVHAFKRLSNIVSDRKQDILKLFCLIGKIDSSISLASLRSGVEKTCKPDFSNEIKQLQTTGVYHPLIQGCVPNSLNIGNKSILITGSNMSGKSSFLRTIAVNSLLAQTIYTCYADTFSTPFLKLASCIRIEDDLLKNKSYYLAEVAVIGELIAQVTLDFQHLFILDEVFIGTNTKERIASGKAILSFLNKKNNIVIVSTHDTELTDLLQNEYDLYHFEDIIEGSELKFDHLIKEGCLKSRNAIKILEIQNYPSEIIDEARRISFKLNNQQSH